jgi:integrase
VHVRLKGINTVRKRLVDGTVRVHHYHRATGTKLVGQPGSAEFLASLAAAAKLLTLRDSGTLAGLIRDYQASADFLNLAETTKQVARWIFKNIEREYGDMPIAAVEDRKRARAEFLKWRDKMAIKAPRGADNTLVHLARVLSWALDRGLIDLNPLQGFRRAYKADRSEKIWLPKQIARFLAVAGPELRYSLVLALHTGQRQGDLIRLPWSSYDGAAITLRQGKSGRRVYIPCTKALREMLDSMQRRGPLVLTTKKGRAWKKRHFHDQWFEVSKKAEISDLHFHDLRGTAITMLSEAGCTVQEIASITGHSLANVSSILDKYLARTKTLARNAIAKLEKHGIKRSR